MNLNPRPKEVKILLFDLETTSNTGHYWGKNYETNIVGNIEYGKILCYGAKWLGKKTFVRGWDNFPRRKERGVVKELWELFNEADILIAHNGRSFDVKWCQTKFIQYGFPPPSPFKVIDTLTEAKKYLYLPSYRLDDIGDYFKLGRKVKHEGFDMWLKCIAGDKRSWKSMKKYCGNDVDLLEKIYLKLLPFMSAHPVSTLSGCVACGGVLQRRGFTLTRAGKKQRTQCSNCYRWDFIRK